MAKYLDLDGVSYLWSKIKLLIPTYFVPATKTQEGIVTVDDQVFSGQKRLYRPIIYGTDNGENPAIWFNLNSTSNAGIARILAILNSGYAYLSQIRFIQYSNDGTAPLTKYEMYNLPKVAANLTANKTYNIITSKDRVETLFTGTFNSSSSATTLTNGMKYTSLILLGRPGDSYNTSCVVPVINITTSDVSYQIAGQANYFCVNIKSSGDDVIMSYNSTSNTSSGRISRVYGIT